MDNEFQSRVEHFAALKSKYQATKYENLSPSSLLYLILRKLDLGIELTEFEFNWLLDHELFETFETIEQDKRRREEELIKLKIEFEHLLSKYKALQYSRSKLLQPLYPILWKLDSENHLNDSEVERLKYYGLNETVAIVQGMGRFVALNAKYQATKYQDSSPDSLLYLILKKLDAAKRLSNSDVNWLNEHELFETLAIFQQQEAAREAEFSQLKTKYQATKYPDSSASSPLYPILQKLDADKLLNASEINWLKQHKLTETIAIAQELEQKREFAALKIKYKATHHEDSSPSSHLYAVLKRLESGIYLSEQDINFLRKRKLTNTIAIALQKYASNLKSKMKSGEHLSESEIDWLQKNGLEEIIVLAQQKHFAVLKSKYRILDPGDELPLEPFYTIMQKLEREERLDPLLVVRLIEEGLLSRDGKIAIAYHRLEALFYEQEFKRTGSKWNLPNASSHWRKADEPRRALQLTNNLDLARIPENKLKSALLTTRGGACLDIEQLDEAEKCVRQAIEYQPDSHHPYTLMGAICYRQHEYSQGDYWFNEAIERGAKSEDVDYEIKRVVRDTKDENKRREVVEYLLNKDAMRYAWAKSYLKKSNSKG
jgi:hypothetical protein